MSDVVQVRGVMSESVHHVESVVSTGERSDVRVWYMDMWSL